MKTSTDPKLQAGAAVWFYHPAGPQRFGLIHRIMKGGRRVLVHYLKSPGLYAVVAVEVEMITGLVPYTEAKYKSVIRRIARETRARDGRSTKAARIAIAEILKEVTGD